MVYYVSYLKDRVGNNYLGLNIPFDIVEPYLNELESILGEEEFKVYSALISRLEASGKKVIFVIDNPTFPDPTSCISGGLTSSQILNTILSRQANPNCQYSYTEYLQGTKPYRDWVNRLQQVHPQLTVFDTAPILCNINENHCGTYEKNQFLYSYSDHISDYAAKKIGVILTPIVDNLVKTP